LKAGRLNRRGDRLGERHKLRQGVTKLPGKAVRSPPGVNGAAVGAIATKKRDGGGHVFLVVGRTNDGRLVGRGGNQSDMVCDEVFDPSVITAFTWPKNYFAPAQVGFRLPANRGSCAESPAGHGLDPGSASIQSSRGLEPHSWMRVG
jgi:hypothetical protein